MNENPIQRPTIVQVIAVVAAGVIAAVLAFGLMWCAIWKIYIDNSLLMSMSTILGTLGGALTTILIGNRPSSHQNPNDPVPTEIKNPPSDPVLVASVSNHVDSQPKTEGKP